MPAGRGKLAAIVSVGINADTRNLQSGMRQGAAATGSLNRGFRRSQTEGRRAAGTYNRVAQQLKLFGLAASGAFIGGSLFTAPARGFLEFDREITKVQTLVGISRQEVDGFRKDLLRFADETGRPVADLARGFFDIQSAGLRGKAALDAIRASALAAAAGLGETKSITEAVTTALGAYGEGAFGALYATDVLLATVREGRAAPEQLVQGFAALLAVSAQAGIEFYDASAAIATLTRTGFDATNAFTGLRQVMVVLNRPTLRVINVLREVGLSVEHLQNIFRERGLIDGLVELQDLLDGTGFNVGHIFREASSGAVIRQLLRNLETARDVQASVRDSTGATVAAWEQWAESVEGRVTLGINRVRTTMVLIGQEVMPVILEELDRMIGLIAAIAVKFLLLPKIALALGTAITIARKGLLAFLGLVARTIARLGVLIVVMEGVAALFTIFVEARRQGVGFWETLGELLNEVFFQSSDVAAVQADIVAHQETIKRNEQEIAALRTAPNQAAAKLRIPILREENDLLAGQIASLRERADVLRVQTGDLTVLEGKFDPFGDALAPSRVRQAVLNAKASITDNLNLYLPASLEFEEPGGSDTLAREIKELQAQAQAELDRLTGRQGGLKVSVTAESFKFADVTFRQLRRETEEASLRLSLSRADNVERAKALRTAQLNVRIENQVRQLNEKLASARRDEEQARARADLKSIDAAVERQQALLGELAVARAIVTEGTTRNRLARQYISDTANAVEQARLLRGIVANEAEHRAESARLSLEAGRDAADLVRGERERLALARIRASYEDPDSIGAQLAVRQRELEFAADQRRIGLTRQLEEAQVRLREAAMARDTIAAHAAALEVSRLRDRIAAEAEYRQGINETINVMRQRLEVEQETADDLTMTWGDFFEGYKQSAEDAFLSVLDGTKSLGDAVKQLVAEMIREFLRLAIIRPFVSSIFGALTGGFGGLPFPTFHGGGLADRGLAVVGEAGPELVDFRRPGRVYTSDQLRDAVGNGGGQIVNITYNIESTDGPGVQRALANARPVFLNDARAYLSRQMASDTRFRQSIRRA